MDRAGPSSAYPPLQSVHPPPQPRRSSSASARSIALLRPPIQGDPDHRIHPGPTMTRGERRPDPSMPSHPLAELRRAARVGPRELRRAVPTVPVLIGPGVPPTRRLGEPTARINHQACVRQLPRPLAALRVSTRSEEQAEPNTAAECRIMHDVKGVRRGRLSAAWAGAGARVTACTPASLTGAADRCAGTPLVHAQRAGRARGHLSPPWSGSGKQVFIFRAELFPGDPHVKIVTARTVRTQRGRRGGRSARSEEGDRAQRRQHRLARIYPGLLPRSLCRVTRGPRPVPVLASIRPVGCLHGRPSAPRCALGVSGLQARIDSQRVGQTADGHSGFGSSPTRSALAHAAVKLCRGGRVAVVLFSCGAHRSVAG